MTRLYLTLSVCCHYHILSKSIALVSQQFRELRSRIDKIMTTSEEMRSLITYFHGKKVIIVFR